MNKKISNLVIITLLLIVIVLILIIWNLVSVPEDNDTKPDTTEVTTGLESVPIEAPIGEDGMKIHTSENGYSVRYPGNMVAKSMAKSVDFILEDDQSGSSLNIVTAKNDGTLKKMTREEFEESLAQTSNGNELLNYEEIVLNGTGGVAVEFVYNENIVKQVIFITDTYGYNITVMKSEHITDEMSKIFDDVVNSFSLE